jgi:hypothetical protein
MSTEVVKIDENGRMITFGTDYVAALHPHPPHKSQAQNKPGFRGFGRKTRCPDSGDYQNGGDCRKLDFDETPYTTPR